MNEAPGQGAPIHAQLLSLVVTVMVRSVVLVPLVTVIAFHLFVVVISLLTLTDTNPDSLLALIVRFVPSLSSQDIQISLEGAEAEQWLVRQYLMVAFWSSLALQALSMLLRRQISVPPRVVWALFTGLILVGSVLFAVQLDNPIGARIAIGVGMALVSFVVGGAALAALQFTSLFKRLLATARA